MSAIADFIHTAEELHHGLARLSDELQQGLPERLARFPRDPEQRENMQREQREVLQRRIPEVSAWLDRLYFRLTELNATMTEEERERALEHHRAAVQPFFLQCPFVRRAVDKPLGYPGDYVTVEMLFGSEDQGVSTLARLLSHYALHCGPAQAHRARPPWIMGHMRRLEKERGRPLRVLSFACGPEHSLREHTALGGTGSYLLCDFDPAPLDYCRRQFEKLARMPRSGVPMPELRFIQLSTYQLIRYRDSLQKLHHPDGPLDIVVAAGILDYLKDNVIARFLDMMSSLLAPGGVLLLTNLNQQNPWRAFMEYVGDWVVVHRTADQFRTLCEGPPERNLTTLDLTMDPSGTNLFWAGQRR
ncbi:MAG TPA: class I SAM-dependent methyltransferase [Archangium sp.]|nr:class I SAM-dependent methyltransferase [Archangium sp.]